MSSEIQIVKCVVVGDPVVGKTCLLETYSKNIFPKQYEPTVFDNFSTAVFVDGQQVSLRLWDTAGQEEYDRLRPISYLGTNIFLLCYSVDSLDSFQNISYKWVPEIRHHCPQTPFVLVGTKTDLRSNSEMSQQKLFSFSEGVAKAKEIGAAKYVECSAMTLTNVHSIFDEAIRIALTKKKIKKKTLGCHVL